MQLTTGHTVDPMLALEQNYLAKRRRAAAMVAVGNDSEAAALMRRCDVLAQVCEQARMTRPRMGTRAMLRQRRLL